jgi:hypothetical protein
MRKYLKAAEERKGMTLTQKQASARTKSLQLDIPLDLLNRAYDSRVIGPEVVNGRETVHVQAKPPVRCSFAGWQRTKDSQYANRCLDRQADGAFCARDGGAAGKEGQFLPGTRVVYEWLPHGDVWLLSQVDFDGAAKVMIATVKFEAAYLLAGQNLWVAVLAHGFSDSLALLATYLGLAG